MTLRLVNPATEQPVAELEQAGVAETDRAVAAAKAAFPAWRAVTPADRARLLRRLAGLIEDHGEELALLETRNVGKPIADLRGEVGMVAEVFHYYAGAVDKHFGQTIPVAGGVDMTFREPLGVVGLIVPWNFPLNIASWKVGPALACGNTVVLKPAELTPMTAIRLAQLALAAGLPEGVLNVVVGPGRVVGERLIHHPDVAKIGFTGSTEVGIGVMRGAAESIKRVTLELGGNRPTSCSATRTWSARLRLPRTRSSATPARTAARVRVCSSSAMCTTALSRCSSPRPARFVSVTPKTMRP